MYAAWATVCRALISWLRRGHWRRIRNKIDLEKQTKQKDAVRHNKPVVLTAYSISSRFFRVKSTPFGMGAQAREGAVAALVGDIAVVSAQLPL